MFGCLRFESNDNKKKLNKEKNKKKNNKEK